MRAKMYTFYNINTPKNIIYGCSPSLNDIITHVDGEALSKKSLHEQYATYYDRQAEFHKSMANAYEKQAADHRSIGTSLQSNSEV